MNMTIENLSRTLYAENPNKVLYHYTSLKGLLGVVKDKGLWASEIRYFNDASEMKHMEFLLKTKISERLEKDTEHAWLLNQFQTWLSDRLTNGHLLFVTSFIADGNLLSQWRGYTPHGKGVSIGFSPDYLSEMADKQFFKIGKCIYNPEKQSELANYIIDSIQVLAKQRGENSKRAKAESYYDIFEEVEAELLRISALVKHPSFQEEEEWRAVSPIMTDFSNEHIQYREGLAMLVPYVLFSFDDQTEFPVQFEHIFLGPTPNKYLSMTSLDMYLSKSNAIPASGVTYCQIPYRQR